MDRIKELAAAQGNHGSTCVRVMFATFSNPAERLICCECGVIAHDMPMAWQTPSASQGEGGMGMVVLWVE